ncbi:MAG: hypothetical protein IPJ41_03230 [Phycisphaerales bacterium]|nr:hypothetical protein [Phycisphaerales bacterium]
MRRLATTLIPLLLALPATAQTPVQTWTAQFNSPANHQDEPLRVALGVGGLFVAGRSYSSTTGDDFTLLRYSPRGDLAWAAQYDGLGHGPDQVSDLLPDGQGGAWISGYSHNGAIWQAAVLHFDRSGSLRWTALIPTPGAIDYRLGPRLARCPDGGLRMAVTSDGNFLVAAWDAAGAPLWTRELDIVAGQYDGVTGIGADSAGNTVVVGPVGSGFGGYQTVMLDPAGDVVWSDNEFGSFGNTLGPAFIAIDSNDEIVVTGVPESTCGLHHTSTWRLSPDGTRLWTRSFPPKACDTALAAGMTLDDNGNAVVLCQSMISGESGSFNFCTLKYDSDGNQLWQKTLAGSGVDLPSAVAADRAGNIYITGAKGSNNNTYDTLVASYAPDGATRWTKVFSSGATNDIPAGIAVGQKGEVYFSEMAYFQGTNDDILTVKLQQPPSFAPKR